jgi:hypothetical protein
VIPSRADLFSKIGVIPIEGVTRTTQWRRILFRVWASVALRNDMMDIHLVSAFLTPTAGEISLLFNCKFQLFTEWHSRALGKDIFYIAWNRSPTLLAA